MKLKNADTPHQLGYRLQVLTRILLASIAGFIIANLSIPAIALFFPTQLAIATYSATLLSFIIWLVFIMSMFTIKKIRHCIGLSILLIGGLGCLVWLLKLWGAA
ncbi:hypothetical protein [Acinetobacter larvae]|uniref:Iron transporter n=1 Tax=Acinetobacter larvae TaxID=1789224 RepID=A0A1B2LZX5_9GAMM|nr:hypothetical protein [Acinetobacter larvae]AOA58469.1 hypothetical protein BFG52_08950 [Acinetobacter larvae]